MQVFYLLNLLDRLPLPVTRRAPKGRKEKIMLVSLMEEVKLMSHVILPNVQKITKDA